ncbi:hypothetical protein JCM5350_000791 [Sporobolomyces pararoseus]
MSTSATQSPQTTLLGSCVVCGEKTSLRCRECAAAGLDWIYFCSQSHQKLVWFAHKRVCGSRSNPFQWPLLSRREVEAILEISEKPFVCDESGTIRTFRTEHITSVVIKRAPEFDEAAEAALNRHSVRNLLENYCDYRAPDPTRTNNGITVVGLRACAHAARVFSTSLPPEQKQLKETSKHFFDVLAWQETAVLVEITDNRDNYPFFTSFQHKFVFLLASLLLYELGGKKEENSKYLLHTRKELQGFCRSIVAQTHPKEAQILLEGLFKQSL